jgi:recombinase
MRGGHGALANKRAADAHAHALVSTIRNFMAAGFVSQRALADELNRRGIATARGGDWHRTTVTRVLARLGLITNGRINNGQAHKQAAEARAKALASTIRKLRRAGFVSASAIARELNEREIPAAFDGKWEPTGVKRLLRRLERLQPTPRAAFEGEAKRPK